MGVTRIPVDYTSVDGLNSMVLELHRLQQQVAEDPRFGWLCAEQTLLEVAIMCLKRTARSISATYDDKPNLFTN